MDNWDIVKLLISIFIIFSICLHFYKKREANVFKVRGVKNLPFDGPFVGNMGLMLFQREHQIDMIQRIYQAFPDQRYVGYKQISDLYFLIRDPELLKQVLVKDFDHFPNHFVVIDERTDSLFGRNLFAMQGDKWHDMRATLSPAFTSSKMRNMFQFVDEISEQMVDFYTGKLAENEWKEKGLIEVELKDAFSRYTNDVIATSAFGLRINSLATRDNEFYEMAKESTQFAGIRLAILFIFTSFPSLSKLLPFGVISTRVKHFFRDVVWTTIKERKAQGIVRPDMIQLLMQSQEGTLNYDAIAADRNDTGFATTEESQIGQRVVKRKWTDDEITAQTILFLIAGYETASTLLCFIAHELALNEDVQRCLQKEIDSFSNDINEGLTYQTLSKMTYMDMVVSETLRKWPPLSATDRTCVKEYQLPPPDGSSAQPCVVKKGEGLKIPIHAIHHDPQYYPNPERFDPMRFSEENKNNIRPFTFLPFGLGPRNCIGSRFALMEVKTLVFRLLRKFDVVRTSKTEDPIKMSPKSINLNTENGFWVGLRPRQN